MTKDKDVLIFRLRTIVNMLKTEQPHTVGADDTYIIATFKKEPTTELVETVRKYFFLTDRLNVKDVNKLVYVEGNTLYVQHKRTIIFQEVYNALTLMGHRPISCRFTDKSVDLDFSRKLPPLNFEQLMLIQDFIRPGQVLTEDLFVIGMFDEYTIMVKNTLQEAA